MKIDFENQILALFDVYFWPLNKSHEKINAFFFDQCNHSFNLKCFYQIPLTWWKTYQGAKSDQLENGHRSRLMQIQIFANTSVMSVMSMPVVKKLMICIWMEENIKKNKIVLERAKITSRLRLLRKGKWGCIKLVS